MPSFVRVDCWVNRPFPILLFYPIGQNMLTLDLTGLNILITGASRGIGQAAALALAGAGAKVALHYYQQQAAAEQLAAQIGPRAALFRANLADASETVHLFDSVLREWGHLDVLVNNAGIALSSPPDLPESEWLADWQRTMSVNLEATALLCKKAVAHFAGRGGGRVINIASRAAFRGDTPDYLAYAASKGGMVALTRSLARAYGKQGIKAFIVAPGFTRTDMAQDFIDQYGEAIALGDLALPKLTEPADLAPMIVLLASGLADHATGATIDMNAGSYVH
jgi:NAD(P)-dependent dehydrogenase (short-subunit alcohol dehydrogenase family)